MTQKQFFEKLTATAFDHQEYDFPWRACLVAPPFGFIAFQSSWGMSLFFAFGPSVG